MDDDEERFLSPPPEFDTAPGWAHALWYQTRRDQHRNANMLMVVNGRLDTIEKRLGQEPDSDGKGGKGLIGDVRALMNLRSTFWGAVAAAVLFGPILVLGLVQWVQSILPKAAPHP